MNDDISYVNKKVFKETKKMSSARAKDKFKESKLFILSN